MCEIESQDCNQHQQPAQLCEEEELRRRVHPPFVTPDRDQEIHGNQHQFPCEVKQEQVHREEHACDSSQDPEEVEVEEPHCCLDLGPGCQHRRYTEEEREHEQQQAQSVQGEVEMDTELRNPDPVQFPQPGLLLKNIDVTCGTDPDNNADDKVRAHGDQRNPAGSQCAPAPGSPCQQSANQQNDDHRKQDHRNNAIATNTTVPAAIPAAYQRTRPFSVRLRPRYMSSFRSATPL